MSASPSPVGPRPGAKRGSKRILIGVLVLAALAGIIWFAVHLAHNGGSSAAGGRGGPGGGGRPGTTVGVAAATQADIPITIDGLGTVTPAATVTVSPQVSGVITQVLFKEGQMVRKGQVLAVIDPRPLQMALLQAQGQLMRDEAQLANARLQLQRNQTLLAQDSIARQDVDTQAALVKQLEGTVTIDRGVAGVARLNLGFSRIVAPVDGRIGLRVVDVGNYIASGSTTGVAVITQVTPIDVEFTVPQDEIPRLQTQAAQGSLAATAFDRTKTQQLDTGTFSTLDNRVDTTTGTVKAKARFGNADGKLFPSQFVNVRLNLQTLHGAVVVPVTAVRTGADGDYVWKLNPDKTVTQRKVTRGPGTATMVSLVQGLQVGEQVITEGGDRLTEGATVQLPGDKPGAGGSAAMQACAADMKKLCSGKEGREAMMCLRKNADKVSPACSTAMAKRHRPGGGGGGGGNQAPAAAPQTPTAQPASAGSAQAPAQAQPSGAPPAQQSQGGGQTGGPSPEMMAARQAMLQACASDAKSLCPNLEGREMMMCMRQNADKAGGACKAAIAKMPRRRPDGAGAPANGG